MLAEGFESMAWPGLAWPAEVVPRFCVGGGLWVGDRLGLPEHHGGLLGVLWFVAISFVGDRQQSAFQGGSGGGVLVVTHPTLSSEGHLILGLAVSFCDWLLLLSPPVWSRACLSLPSGQESDLVVYSTTCMAITSRQFWLLGSGRMGMADQHTAVIGRMTFSTSFLCAPPTPSPHP